MTRHWFLIFNCAGMGVANVLYGTTKRKEVTSMKIAASILAAVLVAGIPGALNSATNPDGIIYKQELTPGSYCHLKFPAIGYETMASDHPVLTDPKGGDIIDFYGPCDEDPRGKDQVHEQKLEEQHQWEAD